MNALSPIVVLRHVAQQLTERTKGLLVGQTSSSVNGENEIHEFFVFVSMLDNYRYRLFYVVHKLKQVYPVFVCSPIVAESDPENESGSFFPTANGQDEFTALVTRVLNAKETKSVIQSLIARVNDKQDLR